MRGDERPGSTLGLQYCGLSNVGNELLFTPQEGPDAEIIGGERSVFYLLMKMFVTSSHLQLKSSTKLLIIKVSVLCRFLMLRGIFTLCYSSNGC